MITRRTLIQSGVAASLASTWAGVGAQTSNWPEGPVKIVVPFSAGGASDILTRALAEKLQARLGQNFVIDNRTGAEGISDTLIEDTRYWLDGCPAALTLYNDAIGKFRANVFQRNLLDDLRLSLELLLRHVFQNQRSLENQLSALGTFLSVRGGSREFTNMFSKLVEYYSR